VVGDCATPTCQFDTFNTYGSGNAIWSNSWYDEANSTNGINSPEQSASGTCFWDHSSSLGELYAYWGVSGGATSPDFLTGYSNRTSLEMEIVDVGSVTDLVSLNIHPRGVISGLDRQFISFETGYQNSSSHRKRVKWSDVDNTLHQTTTTFSAASSTSFYQHTYTIELYDYVQQTGSDSVSRATWQWKVKEDGIAIFESHDGTNQIESRFASAAPAGYTGTTWCDTPMVRIAHSGFGFFSNDMEFDNLKLSVNGDTSC